MCRGWSVWRKAREEGYFDNEKKNEESLSKQIEKDNLIPEREESVDLTSQMQESKVGVRRRHCPGR